MLLVPEEEDVWWLIPVLLLLSVHQCMNGEKKKSQRKAFGARRRGGIRGGRLCHGLETGGVQEALEHPH